MSNSKSQSLVESYGVLDQKMAQTLHLWFTLRTQPHNDW